MNWYVLYIRPKWELKVYQALLERGIEAYCPVYTTVRQWSDRRKKVRVPYINGYVFVRLQETERNRVFGIPGIKQYVFWQGKPARVQEAEMRLMKSYLDGGTAGAIPIERLKLADEVSFTGGILMGRKAYVEKIGKHTVQLVLPVLGYRISARLADIVC